MYDNVIGHSTDIDLMTLTSGKVDISGDLESTNLKTGSITLGTKAITADADEINILDGLQSTTQELNLLDGSSPGTKVNNKAVIYSNNGSISATNVTASGNINATGATVADLTLGVGSIESASGQINVGSNDLVTTGDISANNVSTGTLTVTDGSIQDSEGSISFGTTNLSTSGNITTNTGTVTSNKTITSSLSVTGTSELQGDVTITNKANIGNLTLTNNSIKSGGGSISFDNENLSTTGTLDSGSLDVTGSAKVSTTVSVGTSITAGDITISNGSISSTNGEIDIGTNDLVTTGDLSIGGTLTVPGGISTDGTVHAKNGITVGTGTLHLNDGSIRDTSESISFNTNDLTAIKSISAQTVAFSSNVTANGIIQGGSGSNLAI